MAHNDQEQEHDRERTLPGERVRRDRDRRRLQRHLRALPLPQRGLPGRSASRPATVPAAPGSGIGTRARGSTSRACPTPTHSTSDLQQEWSWPQHYSPQPDLEIYLNHVVDRFDLRRDIRFSTRVEQDGLRRGDRPVDSAHRERRGVHGQVRHRRRRRTEQALRAAVPGPGHLQRRVAPHGQLAEGAGRPEGQAGRGGRHRLVRRADDLRDRRQGGAAVRLPAHPELRRAGAQPGHGPRLRARVEVELHRAARGA